ncbi:MAG: ABC transporter permease subunit [Peptococcaceae bacterium]|jgi:ABC-2 type transport system permease protein|nr:ABC transporter permease subunit [Peptococcaceae bacterium]
MFSIMRRELAAYFHSPIGYIFLAPFYFFSGIAFLTGNLLSQNANLGGVFSYLFNFVIFLVPVLTMRLLSEDRKNKTDQALLTAPITISGMVLGKFLAAALVFALALSVTLVYALVIALYTPPNWPGIIGNFTSTLLLGLSMISIGIFISSMTENQVIAAVGGFAVALLLILIDMFGQIFTEPWVIAFVNGISFYRRYGSFSSGIFEFSHVLFFISVCIIFLFLTVRVYEKRRWS